jgi:transposase-like protein
MKKSTQFSPEVRERAVRMVIEHRAEYPSEWATLVSIASKIGCTPETLRTWCRRQGGDAVSANKNTAEGERIKALEREVREVRELKKANEILRLASAYFAQAELDRRLK